MFIWIYRLLFAPLALLSMPRYLLHIRKRGGYRERFGTRFGIGLSVPPKTQGKKRVWIQAVSLGEMLAIEPLLRELANDGRIEIYLTVTTSTGYALAQQKYGALAVGISYFPLDFWPFSWRVWRRIDADVAICAETELWPEHIRQAANRGVPFLLVNARLSDRSFKCTLALKRLVASSLRQISKVYACSELDRERFLELGMAADRVETTGNIKVDVTIEPVLSADERASERVELGLGAGFLLLGSSTWPGEESMLIEALRRLREEEPEARLLIVPRHAERRAEIETLLKAEAGDFSYHFKSRGLPAGTVDILVADTHGELRRLTQLADLAFVGKSLPPHREGQTPVECGALGVPMIFGSGMSNFRSIREGLTQFRAAREASDRAAAIELIRELRRDPVQRAKMGENGRDWHRKSRGAVERTVAGIRRWL